MADKASAFKKIISTTNKTKKARLNLLLFQSKRLIFIPNIGISLTKSQERSPTSAYKNH